MFKYFTKVETITLDNETVISNESIRTNFFWIFSRLAVDCSITFLVAYYMINIYFGNLVWK